MQMSALDQNIGCGDCHNKMDLNCALEENKKLKIFDPDWLVNILSRGLSNLNMEEGSKTTWVTQYKAEAVILGG